MSNTAAINYRKKLKQDLSIISVLGVLKQIAISEFQSMEKKSKDALNFTGTLESFFQFYDRVKLKESVFLNNPCKKSALVVVSSDEGFFGTLNNQIVDRAMEFCRTHADCHVIVLGRRGAQKLIDSGIKVSQEFPGISLPLAYQAVLPLKKHLMEEYLARRIGSANIIFAYCHSFNRQTITEEKLLPFNEVGEKKSDVEMKTTVTPGVYVEVEPNERALVEYTIALWFGRKLYEIFWSSKLSETACRSLEINERFDSMTRICEKTQLLYFRASHEVIDAGIREIFASQHFAKMMRAKKIREKVHAT